jgi:hypothetical protein
MQSLPVQTTIADPSLTTLEFFSREELLEPNVDEKIHVYRNLLLSCWKPGDDERNDTEDALLDYYEELEQTILQLYGTPSPPEPDDLDYGHADWTDTEDLEWNLNIHEDQETDTYWSYDD